MSKITILNIEVRVDAEGRYSLNDLHKAAGGEQRHQLRYWLELQQTKDIAQKLGDSGIPLSVIRGGKNQGTYVCKQLVYTYAMWLSPEFHIQVVDSYDAMAQAKLGAHTVEVKRISDRREARLESPVLTDAIQDHRLGLCKNVNGFHYSTEFDMINRIVLNQTSKQYRETHDLEETEPIRDYLTAVQIEAVKCLQRDNATMVKIGMLYEFRKTALTNIFNHQFIPKLTIEFARLES